MSDAGAYTIAQNAASCVVYGILYEAINAGGVSKVLPLERIAQEIFTRTG